MNMEMLNALSSAFSDIGDDIDSSGPKLSDLGLSNQLGDFKAVGEDIFRAGGHIFEMFLRNNQRMASTCRINIQESNN